MKKYRQLLLIIMTILSLIMLLIYRNEYLKLRNVLQVLNFFGNVEESINENECITLTDKQKKEMDIKYQFSEPRSVWTNVGSHYLYSSFWKGSEKNGYTKTLAVGPRSAFADFECRVWLEQGDLIISKEGKFTFSVEMERGFDVAVNSTLKYILKCYITDIPFQSIPYGVLIIYNSVGHFIPLQYKKPNVVSSSVLCIEPDYSGISKTNIVELMSYYSAVGISDFIIYDAGVQHTIFPFLESVAGHDGFIGSVSVLQWNFPFQESKKAAYLAYKDDCLSRTENKANSTILISWDEYIIPRVISDVNELLIPFMKYGGLSEIQLSSSICCTDYRDDKLSRKPWPLSLRKSHCTLLKTGETKIFVHPQSSGKNNVLKRTLDSNTATIRKYEQCGNITSVKLRRESLFLHINNFIPHKLLVFWKTKLRTDLTVSIGDITKIL